MCVLKFIPWIFGVFTSALWVFKAGVVAYSMLDGHWNDKFSWGVGPPSIFLWDVGSGGRGEKYC